jgi:hypothetical protein
MPAIAKVTLAWDLVPTPDTAAWIVERSSGGPFTTVVERPNTGPLAEQFVDQPLLVNVTYTYTLSERLTHGAIVQLAQRTAMPFFAPAPSNVLLVGPTGAFPTPQAAIDAAVLAGTFNAVIQIQPGTYPSFAISAVPPGVLHIVGGPGVIIDTTAASVVLQNIAWPGFVILTDLAIGGSTSPNSGVSRSTTRRRCWCSATR